MIKYAVLFLIGSFSLSAEFGSYPSIKVGDYVIRPLQQNIDGEVVEQVSKLCESYLTHAGKPGTLLGSDCSLKDTYFKLYSWSDKNGVKTVFGIYGYHSRRLLGVFTFDYKSGYLLLKISMMLPEGVAPEIFTSFSTYLKQIQLAPYLQSSESPKLLGFGVNAGGFSMLFGEQANRETLTLGVAQNTQFEVCSLTKGSLIECPESELLELLSPEEEALYVNDDKKFFIAFYPDEQRKELSYINNSSEIVNLYKLDNEKKSTSTTSSASRAVKEKRNVPIVKQGIQIMNVTIKNGQHNLSQIR